MVSHSEKQLMDELRKVPLFASVSKKQLKSLASAGKVINWKDGKGVLFALRRMAFARTVKDDADLAMRVLSTMAEKLDTPI